MCQQLAQCLKRGKVVLIVVEVDVTIVKDELETRVNSGCIRHIDGRQSTCTIFLDEVGDCHRDLVHLHLADALLGNLEDILVFGEELACFS